MLVRCVQAGRLRLDDPVARFLPGVREGVLVGHLLSHSSGLDAGRSSPARPPSMISAPRGHTVRDGDLVVLPRRIDNPMCTRGLDPAGGTLVSTQSDILAADPISRTAVVVLTNSDHGINAANPLLNAPGPIPNGVTQAAPVDPSHYAGQYASHAPTMRAPPQAAACSSGHPGIPTLPWRRATVRPSTPRPGLSPSSASTTRAYPPFCDGGCGSCAGSCRKIHSPSRAGL
ncbi:MULTISPECIES: serine hydrolase [Microbacterium]|uniref:serine hydrolase n=1 Tax=Microbacterium TaxID=33882 RepID=UPI0035A91397